MNVNTSPKVYPRIINHVAISVPNLNEAVKKYTKVLGFTVVKQAADSLLTTLLNTAAVKDIHGPRLKKMKMAWLSSANQVGFEIFEFIEPRAERFQIISGNQGLPTFA
jgi:hypothetical protein